MKELTQNWCGYKDDEHLINMHSGDVFFIDQHAYVTFEKHSGMDPAFLAQVWDQVQADEPIPDEFLSLGTDDTGMVIGWNGELGEWEL